MFLHVCEWNFICGHNINESCQIALLFPSSLINKLLARAKTREASMYFTHVQRTCCLLLIFVVLAS